MKIKAEDFARLELAVQLVLAARPGLQETYRRNGHSDERFRWDVLHVSEFDATPLYSYLNDNHINTALRAITRTK